MTTDPSGPVVLDLFCGQGGASAGYASAGLCPIGMDIAPQPRYPWRFIRADALDVLAEMIINVRGARGVVLVHASPPCQAFTKAQRIRQREHPKLVERLRDLLIALGLPYVIENVPGAPLIDPVTLCGAMFGLNTYRHRIFETSFPVVAPEHPEHVAPLCKMGRPPRPGQFMHVVGNFSGVAQARSAMGIDWMNRDGLRESIPPAFTDWIGQQFATTIGV